MSSASKSRILIVGGGGGVPLLLDMLLDIDSVEVVGLCDTTKSSKAMINADARGVKTGINILDFVGKEKIDVIIEASGSKEYQKTLYSIVPKETRIVDSHAAELLINVALSREKAKKVDQFSLINRLSTVLSSGYDINNVVLPVFEILKDSYPVELFAIFTRTERSDTLILACDSKPSDEDVESIYSSILHETNIGELARDVRSPLNVISTNLRKYDSCGLSLKNKRVVPLTIADRTAGYLMISTGDSCSLSDDDMVVIGVFAHVLAMFSDYDSVKRRLADSKIGLESILNAMAEGVIAIDNQYNLTLINPSAKNLLGITEFKYGFPMWDTVKIGQMYSILRDFSSLEGIARREIRFDRNNAEVIMELIITPMADALGRKSGWVILLSDVTKAREVDRLKSEFISTTSHELRTPLTAIKESVMLIQDETAGRTSQPQKRFLSIAMRNIDRLAQLISDLLDLSRIETGELHLNLVSADINKLIAEVADAIQILATTGNINVKCSADLKLPKIFLDHDRISQVLVNLLSNAIKFTEAGGSIDISAFLSNSKKLPPFVRDAKVFAKLKKSVVVSVRDNGVGIKKENMHRLFKKFGQLDASMTRKPGGTGLGLSISKEIVELHGGTIWAESEYGKGSCFYFTIPIKEEA